MEDKNLSWLEEVKRDAEFNYKRILREQQEKREYEASKRQAPQPTAKESK